MVSLDDPVARAEIEILAVDRNLEVVGLDGEETVVLEEGEGIKLPARTPSRPRPKIRKLPPLPPGGGVQALLRSTGQLAPAPEAEITSLTQDEPIFFSVYFSRTGAQRLDLRQLRAVAAQAVDLDRRLVIAAVDPPDE